MTRSIREIFSRFIEITLRLRGVSYDDQVIGSPLMTPFILFAILFPILFLHRFRAAPSYMSLPSSFSFSSFLQGMIAAVDPGRA